MDDLDDLLNEIEVRASMGGTQTISSPSHAQQSESLYPRKSTQLVKLTNELLDLDNLVANIPTAQEVAYRRPTAAPKKTISFSEPSPPPAAAPKAVTAPKPAASPLFKPEPPQQNPVSPRGNQQYYKPEQAPVSPRGQQENSPFGQGMLKSVQQKGKRLGFDQEMLEEINKIRTNPAGYVASLEEYKTCFVDPNSWKVPSAPIVLDTAEGHAAIDETIKLLKSLKPLAPLTHVSEPLSRAMQELCTENGKTGSTELAGSTERFTKYGRYVDKIRELATFGTGVAKEAVWGWIVSDGDKSRINQKTLLDPDMRVIGVGKAKHDSPYQNMIAVAITVGYNEGEESLNKGGKFLNLIEEDRYYIVIHECSATSKNELELIHKGNLLVLTEKIGTNKIYHKWKLPWYFAAGSVAGKFSPVDRTLKIVLAKEIGPESQIKQLVGQFSTKGNPNSPADVLQVDSEQITSEKRDHFVTILPSKYDEDVTISHIGLQTLVFDIKSKRGPGKPEEFVVTLRIPFPPKKVILKPGGPPFKIASDKPAGYSVEAVLVPIS